MIKKIITLNLPSIFSTGAPLCDHFTNGTGSALITHSNNNRLPSSSWRMDGFFKNVGASPSICLFLYHEK